MGAGHTERARAEAATSRRKRTDGRRVAKAGAAVHAPRPTPALGRPNHARVA